MMGGVLGNKAAGVAQARGHDGAEASRHRQQLQRFFECRPLAFQDLHCNLPVGLNSCLQSQRGGG
ncbi:MAG: hypothetical protein CFE43_09290 [Burkholderiales bacterium PBB3]|nr:MAG: hypothetical protein CFE43_09290 [Burkholderiales bacterium PBB3]